MGFRKAVFAFCGNFQEDRKTLLEITFLYIEDN